MTYEEKVMYLGAGTLQTKDCTIHDMFRFIRDKHFNNFYYDEKRAKFEVWLIPTADDYDNIIHVIDFDNQSEVYLKDNQTRDDLQHLLAELINNATSGFIQIIYLEDKRYRFVAEIVETY